MYKKLNYNQLCLLNSSFFKNLKNIYQKEGFHYFNEFIKNIFSIGNEIYYFSANQPIFRFIKKGSYRLIDEIEKIEVELTEQELLSIHNILKDDKKIININNNKSIIDTLFENFQKGLYIDLLKKPFIVYDIETIGSINDLKSMKFKMAYSINSLESINSLSYKYIDELSLKKFAEYLLNFDGYIVGYNNIYFDNKIIGYNIGWDNDLIETINNKSIDLFLFIRNLTGRRLGLNNVSSSLISIQKTLSSGLEGEELMKKYNETGDKKLLEKVKKYCKNDVIMTLGVLLYFLEYKKIFIDDIVYDFNISKLIELGNKQKGDKDKNENIIIENSIFC